MAGRTLMTRLSQRAKGPLLISCKRSELNHYVGTVYGKLEEVPLASKGWNHSKSKNDHFTVLPLAEAAPEQRSPFEELGVDGRMVEALRGYDIQAATEFQGQAVNTLRRGVHTLLAAETGCGKTVAYLVPLIQRLQPSNHPNTPRLVVVVPNRELAYQVGELAESLCSAMGLSARTLVGGATKQLMLHPQFGDVDVLVATPGVLSKLSTVGIYKLGEAQALVLDEADSLTDDSFAERIESLVKRMPQAQLVLVSATLPRRLPDVFAPYSDTMEQVISPWLHRPLLNIRQHFLRITRSVKAAHLLQIAKSNREPLLVFTNRNPTCKWLAMFLRENGVACSNISGDMNHALRLDQWQQFVRGDTRVLSATDVGSRGINTIQVRHVVNYDFPLYAADYLHRIGRVGRLGSPEGCQVSNFVASPREVELVQQIELSLRRNEPLPHVDANITHLVQRKILAQGAQRQWRRQLHTERALDKERRYAARQLIGYSDEQMFGVVADIEHYQDFLPFCTKSAILSADERTVRANLEIGFAPVLENYTSKVTLVRPRLVRAQCRDGRLFHYLETRWKFAPGLPSAPQSCIVDFHVQFRFRALIHSYLAGLFFDRVVGQMERAFVDEARRRYGPETVRPRPLPGSLNPQ